MRPDLALAFSQHLGAVEITPDQVQLLIYAIIAAVVVGGLGSVRALVEIIRFFRGDPPAEQRYASKAEIAALRAEHAALETRISTSLKDLKADQGEIFRELRSIARILGKFEGRAGD